MDATHIKTKFEKLGARAKIGQLRRLTASPLVIDIGHDRHGEFFDIQAADDADVEVLDVQPRDRHLLLMVRRPNQRPGLPDIKDKLLCGHDERHWFVAGVPEKAPVSTVVTAKEALKPDLVRSREQGKRGKRSKRLRRKTDVFIRQGEWFFIPAPDRRVNQKLILPHEPIRRGGGKPHMCEQLYRDGGTTVYVCSRHPNGLTKRMALHFLQAPKDCSVHAAIRWGQVIGLGGNGRLVTAILGSRIGTDFDNDDFWIAVIRWFIQNPTLDPVQIGPLIDYIHQRRFEPQEVFTGPGRTEMRPLSDFLMKGRTAASLLREMHQWHAHLRNEPEKPQLEWRASGIGPFDWTEGGLATNNLRRWTIIELLSRKELYHEGHVLRHCVASYDNSCVFGGTSIWSLGVERNLGRRKRVLTIEVANASKAICQIRGKANRLPNQKEMDIVRRWACQEAVSLAESAGIR